MTEIDSMTGKEIGEYLNTIHCLPIIMKHGDKYDLHLSEAIDGEIVNYRLIKDTTLKEALKIFKKFALTEKQE